MLIYKTDETKIDNEFALDIKEGLTRTTNAKYILQKYLCMILLAQNYLK